MGNIIVSNDFIEVANAEITARSEASGYNKVNIMDKWHLKRRYRADDVTKSDTNPLLRLDLSSAQTVAAIILNDVNFSKVRIKGHASDLGTDWTTASFDSGSDHAISMDGWTGRYKIFIPLTAFNYRWLAILVPSAAGMVGSYQTKFEIGTVLILDSYTTFAKNMGYGFERYSEQPFVDVGRSGRIALNDVIAWEGAIHIPLRPKTNEDELLTFNRMDIGTPLIFYENQSDTSQVWLCVKDGNYSGKWVFKDYVEGETIRLREIVNG